jgi:hypothetical protein
MLLLLLIPAALVLGVPAGAIDLTGTWTGSFKCSEFNGAKDKFPEPAQILRITQTGGNLAVDWVGSADQTGLAIDDVKAPDKKGEAALVDCETTADLATGYGEIALLKAKVDRAKGKGSLKGTSIYSPDGLAVGDCKWSFKLTDPTDPGVAAVCP